MNTETISGLAELLILILLIIGITRLCNILKIFAVSYRNDVGLKKEKLIRDYTFTLDEFNILDTIVDECMTEYCVMHISIADADYITDKIQNTMIENIITAVFVRISPEFMTKLSFMYNRKYIEDTICKKVKFAVLQYTVNINGTYKK